MVIHSSFPPMLSTCTHFTSGLTASIYQFQSSVLKNEPSTATPSPTGTFVCEDSRQLYQVRINFNPCAFAQRLGVYFGSTYQSLTCLILSLHLCLECFTLLPPGADLCLLER